MPPPHQRALSCRRTRAGSWRSWSHWPTWSLRSSSFCRLASRNTRAQCQGAQVDLTSTRSGPPQREYQRVWSISMQIIPSQPASGRPAAARQDSHGLSPTRRGRRVRLNKTSRTVNVLSSCCPQAAISFGSSPRAARARYVDDDVLLLRFARLPIPRAGVAGGAAVAWIGRIDLDRRIGLPDRMGLPLRLQTLHVALVHADGLRSGCRPGLTSGCIRQPPRPFGEYSMMLSALRPTKWYRPAGPSGLRKWSSLSARPGYSSGLFFAVDARTVQGRADGLAQEGTIVASVVPGKAAEVAGRLQNSFMKASAAWVPSGSITTVLPSSSTSWPPKLHSSG